MRSVAVPTANGWATSLGERKLAVRTNASSQKGCVMSSHPSPPIRSSVLEQRDPAWAREFEAILKAYEQAGGRSDILRTPRVASAVISANHVLAVNLVEGVNIEAEEFDGGVAACITVAPGTKVDYPVHLCFGMTSEEGVQQIIPEFEIGDEAEIGFLAHCTFPNAVNLRHVMEANIHVGRGATMRYSEGHYHGPHGGIEVLPTTHAQVAEGGRLEMEFNLVHGRVGRLKIDFEVDVADWGVVELVAKAYGSADDEIVVNEVVRLNGEGARGLTKTRRETHLVRGDTWTVPRSCAGRRWLATCRSSSCAMTGHV